MEITCPMEYTHGLARYVITDEGGAFLVSRHLPAGELEPLIYGMEVFEVVDWLESQLGVSREGVGGSNDH